MNSITSNPSAAMMMANQMIDERVRQARERAQGNEIRSRRRSARRARLSAAPPRYQFDLPWWAFRFVRPT